MPMSTPSCPCLPAQPKCPGSPVRDPSPYISGLALELVWPPQPPLLHPQCPAPTSEPLPPPPTSAPSGAWAPAPSGLCCSRCHGDRYRENCRSSRAVLARSGRWEVSQSGGGGARHSSCRRRGFRCEVEGRKGGVRERGQGESRAEIGWGSRREWSESQAEPAEAAAAAAELRSRNR